MHAYQHMHKYTNQTNLQTHPNGHLTSQTYHACWLMVHVRKVVGDHDLMRKAVLLDSWILLPSGCTTILLLLLLNTNLGISHSPYTYPVLIEVHIQEHTCAHSQVQSSYLLTSIVAWAPVLRKTKHPVSTCIYQDMFSTPLVCLATAYTLHASAQCIRDVKDITTCKD